MRMVDCPAAGVCYNAAVVALDVVDGAGDAVPVAGAEADAEVAVAVAAETQTAGPGVE